MVGYPTYVPLLITLVNLSTWKDVPRSSGYCLAFFFLWAYDLLPAACAGILLAVMLRYRFFPYPTLEDLRSRRKRGEEVESLGESIDETLAGSLGTFVPVLASGSLLGAWKTFRNVSKAKKANLKSTAAEAVAEVSSLNDGSPVEGPSKAAKEQIKAELKRKKEEEDWRKAIVSFLEGIADIHERVRKWVITLIVCASPTEGALFGSIFLWRRASASNFYTAVSAIVLSLPTLPTKPPFFQGVRRPFHSLAVYAPLLRRQTRRPHLRHHLLVYNPHHRLPNSRRASKASPAIIERANRRRLCHRANRGSHSKRRNCPSSNGI